jgi:hypothetical protein
MNAHSSRLLVALSLVAALTGGCLSTTPASSVQSEDVPLIEDPPADGPTQPEAAAQEDEPGAAMDDPACRLQPRWTAC